MLRIKVSRKTLSFLAMYHLWIVSWMFPLIASTFGLAVSLLSMLRYSSDNSWSYLRTYLVDDVIEVERQA